MAWQSVLTGLFLLACVPLVGLLPYHASVDPTLSSASSLAGYNNRVAYLLFFVWASAGVAAFALLERAFPTSTPRVYADGLESPRPLGRLRWSEIAAAAVLTLALFWPPFLTAEGPYYESVYFLNTFHRLQSGLVPYRDFEFSYGPLLLWALRVWGDAFGHTMRSYFWLFAVAEAIQAAAVIALLQLAVPAVRARLALLLVLVLQLANVSLGFNTIAGRLLFPFAAIVIVAIEPARWRVVLPAGVVLGLGIAYSHDAGAAGLLAAIAVLTVLAWRTDPAERLVILARAVGLGLTAVATWAVTVSLILGGGVFDYVAASVHQVLRRGEGEYAFPFQWTVQSLALFLMIGLAVVAVGRGLGRRRSLRLAVGDRLLIAGFLLTLVSMKGGLGRCDMSHLSRAALGLTLAILIPWPRHVFVWSPATERLLRASLYVMVAATALGWAPSARGYLAVWLEGAYATLTRPSPTPARMARSPRAPMIELERSRPDPSFLQLASYLATPEKRHRPVYCYNEAWWLYMRVGVFSTVYPSDVVVLTDSEAVQYGELLRTRPETIVVMLRPEYERLFGISASDGHEASSRQRIEQLGRQVLGRLSSVHFEQVQTERAAVARRVDRTIGIEIRRGWRPVQSFGDLMVLERPQLDVAARLASCRREPCT
jgi:hypothetical protein